MRAFCSIALLLNKFHITKKSAFIAGKKVSYRILEIKMKHPIIVVVVVATENISQILLRRVVELMGKSGTFSRT